MISEESRPRGGAILKWPEDKAEGAALWFGPQGNDTKWFSPSEFSFIISYRVDNLDELQTSSSRAVSRIVSGPESPENGKFAWIMDPDKNKVDLLQSS